MADVEYYRNILKDQTNILDLNIEKYNKILDEDLETLPESVIGQIRLVIGQSRLFINERFKQFSGLIDDCELKRGEKEIKVEDLAGFWDMINYQIDDLKTKYNELEQLSLNNWISPVAIDEKPQKSTTTTNGLHVRKPLQATNGRKKIVTNGNIKSSNINDKVDGVPSTKTTITTNKPIKSNFREFLKNKAKEKRNSVDDSNDNGANINGRKCPSEFKTITNTTNDDITSKTTNNQNNNGDNNNDIVLIMVNNENDTNNLKNGHAELNNNSTNDNSSKDLIHNGGGGVAGQRDNNNSGSENGGDNKTTTKLLLNKMR